MKFFLLTGSFQKNSNKFLDPNILASDCHQNQFLTDRDPLLADLPLTLLSHHGILCLCRNYYVAIWNLFTNKCVLNLQLIQNLSWSESFGAISFQHGNQIVTFLPDYWHEFMLHILHTPTWEILNLYHMVFSTLPIFKNSIYKRASSNFYCVSGAQVLVATCIIIFRRTFRSMKFVFLLLLYFLQLVLWWLLETKQRVQIGHIVGFCWLIPLLLILFFI